MNWSDARRAIESRFQTEFAIVEPTIRIRYPNVRFEEPENKEWVSLHWIEPAGSQVTLGATPQLRFRGEILVNVFVPERSGTARAYTLAQKVSTIFRRKKFQAASSGWFRTYLPVVQPVGLVDGWWQLPVTTEFIRCLNDS